MDESLIGKWVLLEASVHGSVCSKHPHKVLDVKGKRVYLKEASSATSRGEVIEGGERYVLKKTVSYVFDTQEAAEAAGKVVWDISWDWWTVQQDACKEKQEIAIGSFGGLPFKEN